MIRLTPKMHQEIEDTIEAEHACGSSVVAEALTMLLKMHDQGAALAAAGPAQDEFAWVIERGDSQPSAPTYWSGPRGWSQDHIDAVRFARKQDAERVACQLGEGYHRVCEHGWMRPLPAPPVQP